MERVTHMFAARTREVADTSAGDNAVQARGAVGRGRDRSRHGKKASKEAHTRWKGQTPGRGGKRVTGEGDNRTVLTSPREDRSEDRQKGKYSPVGVGKGRGWVSGGTCQDG